MVKLVFNPGNYKYIIKHEKKIRMWTTLQRYQRSVPSFKNQLKKTHAIIYSDFFLIKIFVQNTPFSIWL